VAGKAGIDPGHLSRVERGKGGLSIDALARLTNVLGLHELAQLLEPYRGAIPESAKPAVAASKASRDGTDDRAYHRARRSK
jgi:transcriptional regulator with XRE-family HTH domain